MQRVTLPAAAQSAGAGRAFVTDFGRSNGVPAALLEDAVLLVSEVVGNAYVHAASGVSLAVSYTGQILHIEVGDDSPTHPRRREVHEDATGGRGVMFLDALADRWGVRDVPAGKVVWFDVRAG